MLFLGQSGDLDFYLVQGCEVGLVSQFLSGNVPDLGWDLVARGLAMGLGLLVLVALLAALVRRAAGRRLLSVSLARLLDLGLVLGFFLAWEALLRGLPLRQAYVADPLAFWRSSPALAARARAEGLAVAGLDRQRATGLLDPRCRGARPPGVYRIVFMGDLQTADSGAGELFGPASYPRAVEAKLPGLGLAGPGGRAVQVLNAAMPGFTSWQGLMLLRSDVLPLEPDVVVVAYGDHDASPALSTDRQIITDHLWVWRVRALLYGSRVGLLLHSLLREAGASQDRRPGSEPRTERVPPAEYAENLRAFAAQGRGHSFRVVFLAVPFGEDRAAMTPGPYYRALLRTGAEMGVPVIDGQAFFAGLSPGERRASFRDGIHMTPEGHARMAGLVLKRLEETGVVAPRPR